ncbi:MAG: hypothetical protein WDZ40_02180 [Candidatus Spechtbacterales bacterium]
MPMIHIEYDDTKLDDKDIIAVSNAVQKIVSEATQIKDVFVYANSARIKVGVAPIEVFVRMSASKTDDRDRLFNDIRDGISKWKTESGFNHPVNLTLIPMDWRFEVNV